MKKITDSQGALLYYESYEYTNADSGLLNKVIKTVHGDAAAPSLVTSSYTDKHGRVAKQGRFDNSVELLDTFKYDYLGNRIEEKSARAYSEAWAEAFTKKYNYNYAGKVVKVTDIDGSFTTTGYDALGRVSTVTDKNGKSTTYTYDGLGRQLKEEIPFEQVGQDVFYTTKLYYYDRNGNILRQKVSNSIPGETLAFTQTEYAYNNRNMLVGVTTYDAGAPENYTQYYYDSMGNKLRMYTGLSSPLTINGLDSVTPSGDTEYSVTKYEYDRFNRLVKMTDPLGQKETYTYDLNGNLLQKVDRNSSVITYSYDGMGRLLSNSVVNTADPTLNASYAYTYTATGAKATMSGGGTDTTYTYDGLGRLVKETVSDGSEKNYTYDAANNRKSLLIKVNSATYLNTTYTYDKLNRLHEVFENAVLTATYTYNTNGNRESLTYSNGNTTEYAYNLANALNSLTNKKGAEVLSQYIYTYRLDGNQVTKTDHAGTVTTYSYDDLGRLTSEAVSGEPTVSYTFDDYNNRATMTVAGVAVTSYTYDKNNRLLADVTVAGDVTTTNHYSYDSNGNQVLKLTEIVQSESAGATESLSISVAGIDEASAGIAFYEYDGFNRLVGVTEGAITASYTYNGDGLRTSKTVNNVTVIHVWDGQHIAMEMNIASQVTNKYVRGINLLSAEDGVGQAYYLFNGHGDVVQLADATGTVVKSYDYDAFGNEKDIDPADTNVFRYCGEYFDAETGTIYLRARYYSPVTNSCLGVLVGHARVLL